MDQDAEQELQELLAEVRRVEVHSQRLVTDVLAGGWQSVFRGAGIEFSEVREYEPGDDPRSMDWSVTARTGRPHVKKFVDERQLTLVFLLDLSPTLLGGFAAWSGRQMAARITACLALSASRNHERIGLIASDTAVRHYVAPGKGMVHALRIVRDCLALPAGTGPSDLTAGLAFATRALRRRAVVFVLSDFLTEGHEVALSRCARRHDVIAVRLLAPELAPPARGLQRLRDPRTGRRHLVDWATAGRGPAFGARVQRWQQRTLDTFRRCEIDCIDVPLPPAPDPQAIAQPILRFFRMRERRGGRR
jgi:uncharacterized protein (DUF58 family)